MNLLGADRSADRDCTLTDTMRESYIDFFNATDGDGV
jgi:hypothetical protein